MFKFLTPSRRSSLLYAPLLATGMGLMMVRLLVMASILPIEAFAALSSALVVSGMISTISCFGLFLHLQRSLPIHLARHHKRAAVIQLSQTIVAALLSGTVGAALGASGFSVGEIRSEMLVLGAIHGLSQQLFLIVTTESRSNNEPVRYSLQHLIRSALTLIGGIVAALLTRDAGNILIVEALVGFVAVVLILRRIGARLDVSILHAARLGSASLLRVDWIAMASLLSFSLASAFSGQLDRWLASIYLTQTAFAHYSFAWIAMIAALAVQALVNASVFPMIVRRYGAFGKAAAYRATVKISLVMLVIAAAGLAVGGLFAYWAVDLYLPKYSDSKPIIVLIGVAAAVRLSDFWSGFLIIIGWEKQTLLLTIASTALAVAFWYVAFGRYGATAESFAYLAIANAAVNTATNFVTSWYAARA